MRTSAAGQGQPEAGHRRDRGARPRRRSVLNRCPTPPFEVTEFGNELANEDLRLQYRYLDLRRPTLQDTLTMRHRLNKVIRDYLDAQGFLEVETPLLGQSTPEGARDYLVPSRVYHGEWYALPQSPQLYKQLLMVAGYDKYFQIARCLRDEDLRADRQPEFTQLDLEMSFVEMDDVFSVIEGLTRRDLREVPRRDDLRLPLPRLKYADAMLKYGSDKPDLRYGLEIVDVSDTRRPDRVQVFQEPSRPAARCAASTPRAAADKFSNSELKPNGKLAEFANRYGAKGLSPGSRSRPTSSRRRSRSSCSPDAQQGAAAAALSAEPGDLLLCSSPTRKTSSARRWATLRTHLAQRKLKLFDPAEGRSRSPGCSTSRRSSGTRRRSAGRRTITRSPSPRDEDLADARKRSGQGAGQGVRPGHQRLRSRRRQHSYPQPGGAVAPVQRCSA